MIRILRVAACATAASLALALALPAVAAVQTYALDQAHTNVGFTVKHLGITNVLGHFDDFAGTIQFDEDNPSQSTLDVTVQTKSVNTGNSKRDDHLRSEDFFEVEKYPEMKFVSTSVKFMAPAASVKAKAAAKAAAGAHPKKFVLTGDLTLHGVTKPVVLTGEYLGKMSMGTDMQKVAFTAHGSINRQDFGVKWNRMMEVTHVVSDDVNIDLEVEANSATAGPAGR